MFKKIVKILKYIFCLKCPDCNGNLSSEMIDMEHDKIVYKCEQCGKEWI